jgi:hypothetical protein
MTIESKSYPAELKKWQPSETPFYLELFGETSPIIDTTYAEVIQAGAADGTVTSADAAPIYEYYWTIGHPGLPQRNGGLFQFLQSEQSASQHLWQHLQEPAGRVYVFFPLGGGWRVKELVATVKYLTPVREQQTLMDVAAKDWQQLQPLVASASQIAQIASPAFGPAGVGAASALAGIAKMKINSVPQARGFEWSVGKVTFGSERGVMQGVMWALPKLMFEELGGRLTGSVAVSFIPDRVQVHGTVGADVPAPDEMAILAHAVIYGPDGPVWAPDERQFVELAVAPRLPVGRKGNPGASPQAEG